MFINILNSIQSPQVSPLICCTNLQKIQNMFESQTLNYNRENKLFFYFMKKDIKCQQQFEKLKAIGRLQDWKSKLDLFQNKVKNIMKKSFNTYRN